MNGYGCSVQTAIKHGASAPRRARVAGFTVIEMLTVVSILGIMAAVAAPSFSSLIASKRADTAATDLYVVLVQARSEATKRNANVQLAPKSGGWHTGWQLTVVDPADDTRTIMLDDHTVTNGVELSGPNNLIYQSSGRVQGNVGPCFAITAASGQNTSQSWVWIDLSGRPVVKSSSCS